MLSIGQLRDRIRLQEPTTTRDDDGGWAEAYATVCTVWSQIKTPSGREFLEGQSIAADVTHKIVIRYRCDITSKWQIVTTEQVPRTFGITAVLDETGRRRFQTLMCKEAV